MGTRIKPEERHWFCDACKTEDGKLQSTLSFNQIGRDYQGATVGQHATRLELCYDCSHQMRTAINALQGKN